MSVTLHTNHGNIKIEVFCDKVRRASENFLALCASGYYDQTLFLRNIRGFMVQGGGEYVSAVFALQFHLLTFVFHHIYLIGNSVDPTGTGKGGECIWGGTFEDDFHPELRHDRRGIVSFANNGSNTNGSQFFITYGAQPHLNNAYTVFGQVIDGWETLDAIEKIPVGKKNRPLTDVKLEKVTIHANPIAS
jgi:peptidyl-prolyl cis-trans isomerase-like 3